MLNSLITGGAGFIGSHLAELLLARGDRVTIVDDESTGAAANLAGESGHERLRYIHGSVGDAALVDEVVGQCDRVYHLAAAVGVQLIANDPIRTIETNVYPTQLLLAAAERQWLAGRPLRVFVASTSEVYGKNPKPRWSEDDDLVFGATTRPRWSYGVTKALDEFLALAHHRQTGLPVVIGRFFNVVGPRQVGAYGMVLPRFVEAAIAGRALEVHDDGRQVRCFAHVRDVVDMVAELVECAAALGNVFNMGSDAPTTVLELAERVAAQFDPRPPIEFQSYTDAYGADFEDVRSRVPDLSRLRATIDYRPRYDLDAMIRDVLAWRRGAND